MILNSPYISGSLTVTGNITAQGGIVISGSIASSSFATTASNALTLQGSESSSFAPASTFNTVSQSYAVASGSLSTRVTNLEATSSTVSSSFATTSGSIAGRVTLIEGQYATTGSNNFTKPQQISDVSNAISFTSTASLYTDGGLRVKGSSFISGTAYFNDVVVYGTSSIEYITSSQLAIGTNIITLNTDTPSVRFGGISVFDSGSNNLSTGSLFWDSEKDKWIYSNPSASTYDGGMLISGPRNSSGLGNEVGTTSCALMMGQGGDHITSSAIFSYGNATCFYGQSYISSSGASCFAGTICSPSMDIMPSGIGSSTLGGIMRVVTTGTSAGIAVGQSNANRYTHIAANDIQVFNDDFFLSTRCAFPLSIGTCYTARLTFAATGIATFTCQVCAPMFLASGCIGIGCTTPTSPLTIRNDSSSGASFMEIATCFQNSYRYVSVNAGSGISYCIPAGTSQSPYIEVQGGAPEAGGGSFKIRTGAMGSVSDKFIVNQSGNVGIGTVCPTFLLDLQRSSAGADVAIRVQNTAASGVNDAAALHLGWSSTLAGYSSIITDRGGRAGTSAAQGSLYFNANQDTVERIRMTIRGDSGNVGIGCTSPATTLHVAGGATAEGQIYTANSNVYYSSGVNFYTGNTNRGFVGWRYGCSTAPFTAPGIHLFNTDNSNIVFGTTNTVRATINDAGVVRIGACAINLNTNSNIALQVAGAIKFGNPDGEYVQSYGGGISAKSCSGFTPGSTAIIVKGLGGSGFLYQVFGFTLTGKRFTDLLLGVNNIITVVASTVEGAASSRCYTVTSENLNLCLSGSENYNIVSQGFGAVER